jgi:hypothetical protein
MTPGEKTRWFPNSVVQRALRDDERHFVQALTAMLEEERPAQLDPANTVLTSEGNTTFIPVLPHSVLGGLSVFAWYTPKDVQICWAEIGDLTYHDDLDMSRTVAQLSERRESELIKSAVAAIREQLHQCIEILEVRSSPEANSAERRFRLKGDQVAIGSFPSWFSRFRRKEHVTVVSETSFADASSPVFLGRPQIDKWIDGLKRDEESNITIEPTNHSRGRE